eukprot:g81324.t1
MLQKPKGEETFERCARCWFLSMFRLRQEQYKKFCCREHCMQALYYLQNKSFNNVNRYKGYDSVRWLCPLSSACKLFRLENNELSFDINIDNLPRGISKSDVEQFMYDFIRVALLDTFKSNRDVTSGRNSILSLEDAKGSPAQDISRRKAR